MHFYDGNHNPMEVQRVVYKGRLFLIAELAGDASPGPLLGLFIEDDENYFLKCHYSADWSADLVVTAQKVHEYYQSTGTPRKYGVWLGEGERWTCGCLHAPPHMLAGNPYCGVCHTHRPRL